MGEVPLSESGYENWSPETVRLVHDQLLERGYFPNERLYREYTGWAPVVGTLPADWSTPDASTHAALKAFQRDHGLETTGTPDDRTLQFLAAGHCGVPASSTSASDKWKLGVETRWTTMPIKYRIATSGTIDFEDARDILASAAQVWSRTTASFAEVTTGADITVTFGSCSGGGAYSPGSNSLCLDTADAGNDLYNLRSVAIHELGHALGLHHTFDQYAVMFPTKDPITGMFKTNPASEDLVAATAWYGRWEKLPGLATDIGVGNPNQAWITAHSPVTGGYSIYKWSEAEYRFVPDTGAGVAIDVINGTPWMVNNQGNIYKHNGTNWGSPIGGCARDIGGYGGSIWIVSCGSVTGGYSIYKYVGGLTPWQRVPGGAERIDVDPSGYAWLVTATNTIYRGNGGAWEIMPGLATDIGVGGHLNPVGVLLRYPWITASAPVTGGFSAYTFAEQAQVGAVGTGSEIRGAREWVATGGAGVRISVDTEGRAWLVNSSGSIYRRSRD